MASRTSLIGSSLLAGFALLAVVPQGKADTIIGDWENGSTDGWIDWNNGSSQPLAAPKFTFDTFGATSGTSSLHINQSGWGQNLAIKLQDRGLVAAFLANKQFSIDFTGRGSGDSGWQEIYNIVINAGGYGFQDQPNSKFQYGYPNVDRTTTYTYDYSRLVDGDASNGEISPTTGYVELILTTNSDGVHNDFYFDNARLSTPAAPGDFNANGKLDAPDIDALFHATAGANTSATAKYDVNGDGQVVPGAGAAASDADYWVKNLKGTRYGDADLDKKVAFSDLVVLAQHYGQASGATWDLGSFNGDGAVNFADLVLLAQNYNFDGTTGAALASLEASNPSFAADWALAQSLVPEPTSLAALALGALTLRRRRA